MKATVVRLYTTQYRDPIKLRAGDAVVVGRRDEEYPAWRWCRSADGREGWVPEEILRLGAEGDAATATRDYDATELDVAAGEVVIVGQRRGGWVWVRS